MPMLEERVEIVEERVDRVEVLFGQFMAQTGAALLRIDQSIERIDRSIERMDRSIERMDRSIERMKETVAEMKAEAARDRREWNRRWGELSNRMGTIVEDIIAPSLRRLAVEELGCGPELFFAVRLTKTRTDDPGHSREFDALYVGKDAVLLNETKATARSEYASDFVDFLRSGEFFLYFPEYKDKPVVPVFSSLYLLGDLVTYLTGQGIYAVAMGDDVMRVLNLEEVRARHRASTV